jgi:hypothetical protein
MTQIHWLNAISGSFTNAADWSGGVAPGASDDAILDAAGVTPYTVTVSANETVNSLQTAANATLAVTQSTLRTNVIATDGTGGGANAGVISVSNSATLTLGGAVNNTGSIVMTGGDRSAQMDFTGAGATFTGGGQVTFLANSGAGGGGELTNIDNTISGDINFYLESLVNDSAGVIDAVNVNVTQSELSTETIINRGLIESTGPTQLAVIAILLDNAGGVILAGDGSHIDLSGGAVPLTLEGGTLKTSGTGVIYVNYLIFEGSGVPVNNQGAVVVTDDHRLDLDGTTNNSGSLSLDAASHATFVAVAGVNAVLTGGGDVVLGDNRFNVITGAEPGATLTNVDNTISGAGSIGVYGNPGAAFYLVNEAAGTIDANGAVGLILETGPDTVTNAGLIEATGSSGLTIRNTTVDGSGGGVILAGNASHVGLQGATLIGGTLKSTGNGQIKTFLGGPNLLDGTAVAVSNQAVVIVQNNTTLTIQGAIVNADRTVLTSAGSVTTLTIGAAGVTLSGGGAVNLTNSAGNTITGASAAATLTNVDNTIDGAGSLGAGSMMLINQAKGVIVGPLSTALVIDTGANTITNAGQILAKGAGGVTIQSAVANSGLLEADGGVLTVNGAVSGTGEGMIYAGTLDYASSFSQNVVFQGTTGVLELAQSQSDAGTVFGFSKTGGTSLDLRDIGFVSSTEATFSGTASSGVLTVTDGTHTAHITLAGDYRASTFTASSDGHGGTIIVDPTAASDTAAHRFIAAAAGMANAAGVAIHTGEVWSVREPILVRPRATAA